MDGSKIYTTAEVVIVEDPNQTYTRELDATYGYEELKVGNREK
jgi:predicted DNA-binding protein with PD1-like motif